MMQNALESRRHIGGNLLVIQSGQYRAREQVRSRRIGNYVEDSHPMTDMTTPLWITWHKAWLMLQTSIWFDLATKWQQVDWASRRSPIISERRGPCSTAKLTEDAIERAGTPLHQAHFKRCMRRVCHAAIR